MRGPSFATFFTDQGFAFAMTSSISRGSDRAPALGENTGKSWGLHCTLVGGRERALVAEEEQPARVHQYSGARTSWTTNLPAYGQLAWEEIYPGVDMIAEPARGGLAYAFVLWPGASVSDLVMRWTGATAVRLVDDGRGLDIQTAIGVLRVRGLRAFAIEEKRRIELAARHVLQEARQRGAGASDVALEVDGWNGSTPLVIDPIIAWSSYLGGGGMDSGIDIAIDGGGNAFVVGVTQSTDFPSSGGLDTTLGGGEDAFVTKLSGTGALLWSTYLGGGNGDVAYRVAIDSVGNAFVTGHTQSADFPSSGGFDTTLGGGLDAFVAKVSGSGSLLWSSYLGGKSAEIGRGIAVAGGGNALVTGSTESTDFPSNGGFDTSLGGSHDAFVTKVSGTGVLLWSSYLGGSATESGIGIAVDGSLNALITGPTSSTDFPALGGFDTTLGGPADAFIAKVSGLGGLLWSSYLGGALGDGGWSIGVDSNGSALVTGVTRSTDFPSSGGFDATLSSTQDVPRCGARSSR